MASLSDVIATLKSIQIYTYRFGGPILIFIGTIGCILNLIVFTQKLLRKNPCSIYFIAYNLANLPYIYITVLFTTLDVGYSITLSSKHVIICRLYLYFFILLGFPSPSYLILAAVDRIFITSPNALTRRRSNLRFAYISVALVTLFWVFGHSHLLALSNLMQNASGVVVCSAQQGLYNLVMNYILLIKDVSAFFSITICGLWSIRNIRNTARIRVAPDLSVTRTTTTGNVRFSAKDRQLMLMLIMDAGIYVVFNFAVVSFLIYRQITLYYTKTRDRLDIETSVRLLSIFSAAIPYCTSCYTSLIISKTFRNEMKKIFDRIRHAFIS